MSLDWNIILIIFVIIIGLVLILDGEYHCLLGNNQYKNIENYAPNIDNEFNQYAPIEPDLAYYYATTPSVGWLSRRGLLPWWNSTRDTTNMSYDIRGDVTPIHYDVGPFWVSPHIGYKRFY